VGRLSGADGGAATFDSVRAAEIGALGTCGVVTTGAAGARGTSEGSGASPSPGAIVAGAGGISLIGMTKPHFRHFIRTERPATFSSAIWYFALQLGQRNFIR
jgi:hypothetical protein